MDGLTELYFRHKLCDFFIKAIMQMDDPRKEDALAEYKKQQTEIDAKITILEKEKRQAEGLPEPKPITVGLKSAMLIPRTK